MYDENGNYVLIVAKCIVNRHHYMYDENGNYVLIVAKCIVNANMTWECMK